MFSPQQLLFLSINLTPYLCALCIKTNNASVLLRKNINKLYVLLYKYIYIINLIIIFSESDFEQKIEFVDILSHEYTVTHGTKKRVQIDCTQKLVLYCPMLGSIPEGL